MNATVGKDTVTLLNSGNYMYWRTKLKAILIRDELWDVVSVPKTEEPMEAWSKLNNMAMALIILSVDDSQLLYIANCDTAFQMWEELQKQHARSSFGSQLYLRQKLYGIRFTSGTMQARINSILEVVELLRGAGPVTALEGCDEADLSVEYVTSKMLDEYQRSVESYDLREDDDVVALWVSSRRGGRAQNGRKDQP
uniref:DUF4219 domain-containing protein n=1 Tax=Trichuris muris TaxID=70415 RepID=A0A5S6QRC7_TRIMR